MATLATQLASYSGITPSFDAADAGGDQFTHHVNAILYIKNGGGSPINATLVSQRVANQGYAVDDTVVNIAAGAEAVIGNLDRKAYADADGNVQITYDSVTSVTVAVIR